MSTDVKAADGIEAITKSLPPASDYLTYLTIVESHLAPEILPTLHDILQDVELTQNIGWDLVHLLLPLPGAETCLTTIARLGNPREVVLKVTESLQGLDLDEAKDDDEDRSKTHPTAIDQFCTLTNLLSILLPRIKTKFPSRFLSTSLMALLSTFRPSDQAASAVLSFVHTISGKKRPPLPGRKSSLGVPKVLNQESGSSAPDPEAQEADPQEAAIQEKLLQSFISHILEDYVNANPLEWAARIEEHYTPEKVLSNKETGRIGTGEAFKEQPELQTRDTIAGQLLALARDLDSPASDALLDAIYKTDTHAAEYDPEENYPSSPDDIPLSQAGSLFLIAASMFSSALFDSKTPQPQLSIFPDHAKLVKHFIGTQGPANIGSEDSGVIDAVLAIGLWLEHKDQFVNGPVEDEDFLQHLQSLSLLSANNPSPTLRYAAHVLTSSILHAHPTDRLRLTFITDTLEHCPYESLKASAVGWLKHEIITANQRKTENVFATTTALAAAQPYLFPDTSELSQEPKERQVSQLLEQMPLHMAIVNFLYFISNEQFAQVVPTGMRTIVEEIYLGPLSSAQESALGYLNGDGDAAGTNEQKVELQLLGHRIALCSTLDEAI